MILTTLLSTVAASEGARAGSVAVGESGGDMTPWLAVSAIAMIAMLLAAQWIVARGPRQ